MTRLAIILLALLPLAAAAQTVPSIPQSGQDATGLPVVTKHDVETTFGTKLDAGGTLAQPVTGAFYGNAGAGINRAPDRMLIGAAADNPANSNRDLAPRDWLSNVMGGTSIGAYPVWGAQGAALARFGTIGFLTASRTSDARASAAMLGYTPASIGHGSWCINDDTANPTTTTCWASYGEAWRMPGVNQQPTFGMELEGVNFGGLAVGVSNPYHPNVGGGVYGIQLGCGGGQTAGTSDCGGGIVFVANPNRHQVGVTFGAASLTGTDGSASDNGYATAVQMGRNQALEWHTPEVVGGVAGLQLGAFIRSSVKAAANGQRIEFQDSATIITNASGQLLFSVGVNLTPASALQVQAGTGGGAPGLYVQQPQGGSANLGLYPAAGGELQIASPVVPTGLAPTGSPDFGFLHINVNGVDARVPLFSPAQAGG